MAGRHRGVVAAPPLQTPCQEARRASGHSSARPGARVASRNQEGGELDFASEAEMCAAISKRFGIKQDQIEAEIQLREQFLGNLLAEGRHSRDEVRKAVVEFYRSKS